MLLSNNPPASFGWHTKSLSPEVKAEAHQFVNDVQLMLDIAQKVALVVVAILAATAIAGLTPIAVSIAGCVGAFATASVIYGGSQLYKQSHICRTAGMVFNHTVREENQEIPAAPCDAIPTEHCADTVEWRKQLIAAAEHNIVISGNYCGGDSFVELLQLIRERIAVKPDLQVVIISSPNFLTGASKASLEAMKLDCPNNFSLVASPDIWHISPGLKKSTNHTKGFVIDYGKYFILGGSGIKDNFAKTGLDNLPNEIFLQQSEHASLNPGFLNGSSDDGDVADGIIRHFVPGNFRDMDFVFHASEENPMSGQEMYKQMLLLAFRWEQYDRMLKRIEPSHVDEGNLGLFTGAPSEADARDSITEKLLKTPIPVWSSIHTHIDRFHASVKKAENVAFQIISSGPEHNESVLARELLKQIESAESKIVINHMYFHPTDEILEALAAAAERGVNIKIITAGEYKDCPNSHYIFGPRNRYNCADLGSRVSEANRSNVEVYEFQQKKKGLHKKVIIVDDTVIAGSSNLGYKSLVTTSDHEINFIAKSADFANETMKVCNVDLQKSIRRIDFTNIGFGVKARAAFHRILAPLIG